MPVILHLDNEDSRLSPKGTKAELKGVLASYPKDKMEYYKVSTVVNSFIHQFRLFK